MSFYETNLTVRYHPDGDVEVEVDGDNGGSVVLRGTDPRVLSLLDSIIEITAAIKEVSA